mmetsp:Transcript_3916/g.5978  ORF Transcript_3916/g.5978 Transcript_3916/m.5978 type:complete len:461 (-) Transcript_3916:11-1393(-)
MKRRNTIISIIIHLSITSAFTTNSWPGRRKIYNSASKDFSEDLIPEESPLADPNRKSLSGVTFSTVLEGLHKIYPPSDLEKRNAASRSDGYWPFIQEGKDPPKQLTYGEFDFYFFAELLDKAHGYCPEGGASWDGNVFCDIGSGTGRLVLAAAALHSWKLCRGVELLKSIHDVGQETLEKCRRSPLHGENRIEDISDRGSLDSEEDWLRNLTGQFIIKDGDGNDTQVQSDRGSRKNNEEEIIPDQTSVNDYYLPLTESLPNHTHKLAPIELTCGSFEDRSVYFGDADCIFVFSSCMSSSIISSLSKSIARQCRLGTIVITTEFPLQLDGEISPLDDSEEDHKYSFCDYDGDFDNPDDEEEWEFFCQEEGLRSETFNFKLLESVDGYCWLTGGCSTAYIHQLVNSTQSFTRKVENEISDEEMAARAWIYSLQNQGEGFYRDVRNNMIFNGFTPEWYEGLEE